MKSDCSTGYSTDLLLEYSVCLNVKLTIVVFNWCHR